jgi:hypothetical protein
MEKPFGEKEAWFLIGYVSAFAVLWIAGSGLPRLLDFLLTDEPPAEVVEIPTGSANGTDAKAEQVVKEVVE